MGRKNRYSLSYKKNNIDSWFHKRERIFIYYYISEPEISPEWKDLTTTGCRYIGWVLMDHRTRGEIWLYPTDKHRMMVQLLVPAQHILWKKQFIRMRSKSKKDESMHAQQLRQLIKRNSNFWFYE